MRYGVFSGGAGGGAGRSPRVGALVGDVVVDLAAAGLDAPAGVFERASLNAFMALGPDVWASVHEQVRGVDAERFGVPVDSVQAHLPVEVADYVDFYASIHHATNVGKLFRPDNPLMPNWRHLPVGYHGRSGTVVVSGTPVRRPHGQRLDADGRVAFGPSVRLDFELEVGFVVGVPSRLGEPVPAEAAAAHVFGVVLLNDWSARDIQAWEYQPLGPFLGKSFATSISAWVTPLSEIPRAASPAQTPEPLPYLQAGGDWGLAIRLEALRNGEVVTTVDFADAMYWTLPQLVAHCTVNGASLRTGDILGSGTVSGPDPGQQGCLLEQGGAFLEDGDEVVLRADCLSEVAGRIVP